MSKFYATFGCGHPLGGYALELIARDDCQVRAYMNEYFNNHYCTIYNEDRWLYMRRVVAAKGYVLETVIATIDITEFTKD